MIRFVKKEDLEPLAQIYKNLYDNVDIGENWTIEKALLSIPMNEYNEFVDHFYKKCNELVDDLLKNGIAPYDVNEDNVLVNMSTKDITLVDLDDDSTKYMSKKYILKHSYIGYNVKTFGRIHDCIEDIEFMRMNDK